MVNKYSRLNRKKFDLFISLMGGTPGSAQGLTLALYSGLNCTLYQVAGIALRTICNDGSTKCKARALPTVLSL